MKRNVIALAVGGFVAVASVASAADLDVGKKAPSLHIAEWVQGDPFDLSEAKQDDVTVVEFWATWCGPCIASIPHMSEMQDHFKERGVTFIGVSSEKPSIVKKFLNKGWDKKMRYRVALDKEGGTNKAWMDAAGKNGIPTAFVVKGSTVKWIGHPMAGLDLAVAELCGDEAYAENARKIQNLREEFGNHHSAGNWKKAIVSADQLLKLVPGDDRVLMTKYQILATQLKDTQAATKAGREFVAKCNSAAALNEFAWNLLTEDDFAEVRDVKLAKSGAEKACELTQYEDAAILDTYARALADSGDLAGAIKWQKKAVEACDNPGMKPQIEKALEDYQQRARDQKVG